MSPKSIMGIYFKAKKKRERERDIERDRERHREREFCKLISESRALERETHLLNRKTVVQPPRNLFCFLFCFVF